jgi:adenylate cyclase
VTCYGGSGRRARVAHRPPPSLACLALDMHNAVADPCRSAWPRGAATGIGLAAGPVVAGVVGARKFFFYGVFGATQSTWLSRMEATDVEGRIRAPGYPIRALLRA